MIGSLNEVDTLVCVLLEVQHFEVRIALHFQQPFFSFRFSVVEQHRFHQKFDSQQRKKKERYESEQVEKEVQSNLGKNRVVIDVGGQVVVILGLLIAFDDLNSDRPYLFHHVVQ